MHEQYDARPIFTFPAAEHHHSLTTGTKLYCLVNRHMCINLPLGVTW